MEKKYFYFFSIVIIFNIFLALSFALQIPITYDEAFTYLNFTRKGILSSMTFYPAPNNHILHSLLTNLTYYLPFSETINLRIPTIFVNILAVSALFYTFLRLLNVRISIFIIIIYSVLPGVIEYAFVSRGYTIILMAFIISFYSAVQILRQCKKRVPGKYFVIFGCSALIGFYTMPSFLYPFFAIYSFLFLFLINKKKLKEIFNLLIMGFFVGFFVLILYIPIFIVSGLDSVISNHFVAPISREVVFYMLGQHFEETVLFLFGTNHYFFYALFLLAICFLTYKIKRVVEVQFVIYILAISPVLLIIHSVIPFPRTWIYLIIPVLYLLALVLDTIKWNYLNKELKYILPIFLAAVILLNFYHDVKRKNEFSFVAQHIGLILKEKKAKIIFVQHPLIDINLLFFKYENDLEINIHENDPYLTRCYDFLVLDHQKNIPEEYVLTKSFSKSLFLYQMKIEKASDHKQAETMGNRTW